MIDNRLAIASVSLGQHASHTLPNKITAAAQNGFSGMEITYPDLESYANIISTPILEAAQKVRDLCKQNGLQVIALVPFENFEGSSTPLTERLKKAERWFAIARILGAEFMQVPSSYDRNVNNDHAVIVSELRQLSDLARAATPVIKIAYENLAWSSTCSLWQEALKVVEDVDRDNFGLCLDSFHLTTKLWADAYSVSGRQANGDEKLAESLRELIQDCPMDKIFFVQLSDGERLSPPYSKNHPWYNPDFEVGHVWSMEARPFPLEEQYGAFMPVQAFTQALLVDKGFSGWVSLETFDRRMRKEENSPAKNASRAAKAWQTLRNNLLAAQRSNRAAVVARSRL